jgi:hypothetical protein
MHRKRFCGLGDLLFESNKQQIPRAAIANSQSREGVSLRREE